MGELTRCNFCSLKDIRKRAKEKGGKISILNDARWGMGGKNVYRHPEGINIRNLPGGEDGERAKYRIAWMGEIPNSCQC